MSGTHVEGGMLRKVRKGVCIVAQQLVNLTCVHGSMGSIPGLAQWVGDPALLRAEVWVADTAWILCCSGRGRGGQLQL